MVETSPAPAVMACEARELSWDLIVDASPPTMEVAFETGDMTVETSPITPVEIFDATEDTTLDARLRREETPVALTGSAEITRETLALGA